MYNDTITVFNRKENMWYPTVLHNVNLNMDRAAILAKYGESAKDTAALNVRFRTENGERLIGNKTWLPPKEWEKLADPAGHITFRGGDTFDFFVLGKWAGDKPIDNDEYFDRDGFYNYMNKEYDYVFAVSSVGGPYSVIPHFEIMGR